MRTTKGDLAIDPRGLIFEAYRMDIGPDECRTIFLDWAMGSGSHFGPAEVGVLLARYGAEHPDHPMTAILREGLGVPAPPARRRRPTGTRT